MKKKVSKKAKRRLVILFSVMLVVVAVLFGSVFSDWKKIYSNNREIKKLNKEYKELLDEERSLESEVIKFQDPDYIARYAREKYLYSLPGELIIKIPSQR